MNEIEFCIDNYLKEHISFEEARNIMNADIISTIDILLKNKYIMVIREDFEDIVKIEFDYSNYHYENESTHKNPYWVTVAQYNSLLNKEFYNRLP